MQGGTVYYLYEAPADKADLKNELKVLETLGKWNKNLGDNHSPSQLPLETKAPPPATRLVVTAANHKSTHASYADQPKHLTVYICTDANWALDPHEYGAVAHVFPVDEDAAKGYHEYFLHAKKRQKLNSEAIKAALALAEAKDPGTLGQGDLA